MTAMEHLEGKPKNASTYSNHKCRCDDCRAAWAVKHREYMHRTGRVGAHDRRRGSQQRRKVRTRESDYLYTSEVLDLTGLTYRQLTYAAHKGVVVPDVKGDGSGNYWQWAPDTVRQLRRWAKLTTEFGVPLIYAKAIVEALDELE